MTLEELKDSDFVVGMKETERAIEKREASAVFIASDCDERISAPLLSACQASDLSLIHISEPTRPMRLSRMPSSA